MAAHMPTHSLTQERLDCPPADAEPAEGWVFRGSKNNPPIAADLQTADETGRLVDADPCLRKALSVFRSRLEAEHQARLFRRWKRKYIVQAELTSEHGKIKLTPTKDRPSHTSWWPSAQLDSAARAALFRLTCEVAT